MSNWNEWELDALACDPETGKPVYAIGHRWDEYFHEHNTAVDHLPEGFSMAIVDKAHLHRPIEEYWEVDGIAHRYYDIEERFATKKDARRAWDLFMATYYPHQPYDFVTFSADKSTWVEVLIVHDEPNPVKREGTLGGLTEGMRRTVERYDRAKSALDAFKSTWSDAYMGMVYETIAADVEIAYEIDGGELTAEMTWDFYDFDAERIGGCIGDPMKPEDIVGSHYKIKEMR